ncbi:MAG: tetratricopeptide repeat protein [Deltaproteobacteria bacterium]|nr:tetratricopeptide repeat protein [Deltaproteobacteria bacterium]
MVQESDREARMPVVEDGGGKISGYYIEEVSISLGTGATKRKTTGENIFLAEELPCGRVKLSLLNMAGQPTTIVEEVEKEEFFQRCRPKPDFIPPDKTVKFDQIKEKADRHASLGNLHLRKKEFNSAEFEFQSSLKLDEEHVRANYGMVKLHLEKGEEEKAKKVLKKLTSIEALFEEDNKHIFNEFGIDLRRMKMYDQALDSYRKAMEINDKDPILKFNMARALIDKKLWAEALECLEQAILLKQEFPEAEKLARLLRTKLEKMG